MQTETHPVVFLKGGRVYLRPPMKSDIPRLLRWINDPEVNRFLGSYLPMLEQDEEEWFEELHKGKLHNMVFAIMLGETHIGNMGIHRIDWKSRVATTGALIGEKDYWGKGYGSEAKMLLLNYAFNTLNLRKICSNVVAFNERSVGYSLRCGYQEEGRLRAQHYEHGAYWDEIRLAVFKEDWLPLWEEFKKDL